MTMLLRGDQGLQGGEGHAWQIDRGETFRVGARMVCGMAQSWCNTCAEFRQSGSNPRLPLGQWGGHGPIHELSGSPLASHKDGRNNTNLSRLWF